MDVSIVLRRLGVIVVHLLPHRAADHIAYALGWLTAPLARQAWQNVQTNIRHIYPGRTMNASACNRLARATIGNYSRALVDFLRLGFMSQSELLGSVQQIGVENIVQARQYGRGCVLITLHLGNWDYAGSYLAAAGVPMNALVERLSPAALALFTKHRERFGMRTFPVERSAQAFINTIRENRVIAVVADRDVSDTGTATPFFDGHRALPRTLGAIVVKHNLPVVFGFMSLNPRGAFPLHYLAYIEPPCFFVSVDQFMKAMVDAFERFIRRNPDQWFALQPEWLPEE